eukprot:5853566-Amphidinium_carterae.1
MIHVVVAAPPANRNRSDVVWAAAVIMSFPSSQPHETHTTNLLSHGCRVNFWGSQESGLKSPWHPNSLFMKR